MVCNITQDIIYHLLCIWYDTSSNGIVDLSISSLSKRSIGLTSRLLQNISYMHQVPMQPIDTYILHIFLTQLTTTWNAWNARKLRRSLNSRKSP